MPRSAIKTALLFAAVLQVAPTPGMAGSVAVPGAFLGNVNVPVTSVKELRFKRTVQQQYDFSCGSAALATLLTYHYEDRVSEDQVFVAMFENGDKEKIRREGFSLLDMKKYLERRGYQADGYRITLDKLEKVGIPAIALVNIRGYRHFIVLKGVTKGEVLLGDPAQGARTVPRGEFERWWNGLVFLVRSHKDLASRHFNEPGEWPARRMLAGVEPLTTAQLLDPTLFLTARRGF
ncbi:C39 family peptidase [Geomonas azotofigens]|uniref:C39 family peptidase n=1 Tax=Geomonas azotofigens TaxID=2843196 RepID=UPI001C108964|nr:C39 family peptidase [Geomonas azotofigens]MBU5612460.1 C39 family peptidase [Geomonas azotofigens]